MSGRRIVRRGKSASRYCRAHITRAIQAISLAGMVRSGWPGFSALSSTLFAVLRLIYFAVTSPLVVRTTTRSPLLALALGETIRMSPSR